MTRRWFAKWLSNKRLFAATANNSKPDGYFLRIDRLKSGDVVLMRGTNIGSAIIAFDGKGPYSHAALILSSGTEFLLFDAQEFGIGGSDLRANAFGSVGGEKTSLIEIPNVNALAVWRHPLIEECTQDEIARVTAEFIRKNDGLRYSLRVRLLNASRRFQLLAPVLRPVFRLADRTKYPEQVYGSFCSELNSKFFEMLGLHLFESLKLPDHIGPNDLSRSRLVKVNEAVVMRSDIENFQGTQAPNSITWQHVLRKEIVDSKTFRATVEDINRKLEQFADKMHRENFAKYNILYQGALINLNSIGEKLNLLETTGKTIKREHHFRVIAKFKKRCENLHKEVRKRAKPASPSSFMYDNVDMAMLSLEVNDLVVRVSGLSFLLHVSTLVALGRASRSMTPYSRFMYALSKFRARRGLIVQRKQTRRWIVEFNAGIASINESKKIIKDLQRRSEQEPPGY